MSDQTRGADSDSVSADEAAASAAPALDVTDHTTADEPPAPSKPLVEPMAPRAAFWTRVDRPFIFGFLVTLGGLAAILLGLALSNLSTVLIYIALALFAALGLDPAVRWIERRGISRAWSVLLVILAFTVVLAIVITAILPVLIDQVTLFVTSIPATIQGFLASDLYFALQDQFGVGLNDLMTELQRLLSDPARLLQIGGGVSGVALQVGGAIGGGISGAIIVIVLTLYFLATLPSIQRSLTRLAPARDRRRIADITSQITDSVGGYVMGMVTLAFINAMLVLVLYLVLGLPFPPLMATVAFCITLIPLVGSVLFWVIGSLIALFSSPISALIFAIIYVIYMQVEAYVVTPRVMNRAISIPGSLVVIGALVGGTLLGLLGALVAVPVTASILIIIQQVWIPRQDARI